MSLTENVLVKLQDDSVFWKINQELNIFNLYKFVDIVPVGP